MIVMTVDPFVMETVAERMALRAMVESAAFTTPTHVAICACGCGATVAGLHEVRDWAWHIAQQPLLFTSN